MDCGLLQHPGFLNRICPSEIDEVIQPGALSTRCTRSLKSDYLQFASLPRKTVRQVPEKHQRSAGEDHRIGVPPRRTTSTGYCHFRRPQISQIFHVNVETKSH